MKRFFLSFFTSALLLLLPIGASAQGLAADDSIPVADAAPPRSIFSVSNIPIDVSAASSAAARSQAIAQARRLAFTQVFQKMVAIEDWSLEPALTNSELADLVSAIDVRGEKSSSTRYVADLSVTFDGEAMLALFKRLGVTYTDSQTPPIILLPIAHYAGLDMLWSPDNVWRTAWETSASRAQSLVSYNLLSGNPVHTSQVSALGVREAGPASLISLIRGEKASDIVLAYARIEYQFSTGRYSARFDIRRGPQQGPFMTFSLEQGAEETAPEMLERGIFLIDQELSSLWKRQLLVEYAQAKDVLIAAEFETPEAWRTILAAMGKARRLRGLKVGRLNLKSADIHARFFGDFEPLLKTLAAQGVMLERSSPSDWRARVMTSEERSQLQMRSLSEAVEGYVDPLQGTSASSELTESASGDFDIAPWEMSKQSPPNPTGLAPKPETEPEAAFQP